MFIDKPGFSRKRMTSFIKESVGYRVSISESESFVEALSCNYNQLPQPFVVEITLFERFCQMAKKKNYRRRRSDYASRLSARRKDALAAYFKALGGPKDEASQAEQMAKDAGVKASTFRQYLGGKVDMGAKSCEKLQAKLDNAGKVLAEYSKDPNVQSCGIWIFANPKRKVPFLPQAVREERAKLVNAKLNEIASALGLKCKTDDELYKAIAKVVNLKPNSVMMVANSCSYMSEDRLQLIKAALEKKGKNIDIALLGQDPRNLDDSDIESLMGDSEQDDGDDGPQIQAVAAVLAELKSDDVLIVTGSGQFETFTKDSAAVVVIRPGAQLAIHSVPAGCVVEKGALMSASDGSGVISIPFKEGND